METEEKLAKIGQAATAIAEAMKVNGVKTFEEIQVLLKALVERKLKLWEKISLNEIKK